MVRIDEPIPRPISPKAKGGLVDNAMRAINQRIRAKRLRVGDPVPSEADLSWRARYCPR